MSHETVKRSARRKETFIDLIVRDYLTVIRNQTADPKLRQELSEVIAGLFSPPSRPCGYRLDANQICGVFEHAHGAFMGDEHDWQPI